MIEALRGLSAGPFNVNVFCHRPAVTDQDREHAWLARLEPVFERYGARPPATIGEIYTSFLADEAMVELLAETRPAVVSFHFGLPSANTIARLKAAGIILFSAATNLEEAEQAVAAGRAQGEGGFGAQWAGQGAPLARALPAAELVAVLAAELAKASGRDVSRAA
jgi:nitronate monooxygenase